MDNEAVLHKEIDLIQGCITRMAQNSFIVKGWLISILAVSIALLPETINIKLLCIGGVVIIFCFWYLDGFFLKMERLYRWKYEWVIKKRQSTLENVYDLNPRNSSMWLVDIEGEKRIEPTVWDVMISRTLVPLYLPLIGFLAFIFINTYRNWI
jgi:hypothetical protein